MLEFYPVRRDENRVMRRHSSCRSSRCSIAGSRRWSACRIVVASALLALVAGCATTTAPTVPPASAKPTPPNVEPPPPNVNFDAFQDISNPKYKTARQRLKPHETQRPVHTASAEQVRQPISASGLESWKPFEPWLGPLKDALGPTLDAYPDPPAH